MPVSINNNKKLISIGDVEPSALDLTRHLISGESLTSVSVIGGPGLSVTSPGEIGLTDLSYGRTNRNMKANSYIKWTHIATSQQPVTYIDIDFTTSLGQTKNLRLNFEIIS
jgi:hypothetical protein